MTKVIFKQCLASTPSISSPAGFCLLEQQRWKRVFQPKVVLEREGQDRETLNAEDILLVFYTGLALSTLEMSVYKCGQWESSQQQQPLQEAINLSLSLSPSLCKPFSCPSFYLRQWQA